METRWVTFLILLSVSEGTMVLHLTFCRSHDGNFFFSGVTMGTPDSVETAASALCLALLEGEPW